MFTQEEAAKILNFIEGLSFTSMDTVEREIYGILADKLNPVARGEAVNTTPVVESTPVAVE